MFDLPDIPIPSDQFEKMKQKYLTSQDVLNRCNIPTNLQLTYKKTKRKFELVQQIINKHKNIREESLTKPSKPCKQTSMKRES